MINFNFGAAMKPLVLSGGEVTQASVGNSLPAVIAGTGIVAYSKQVPSDAFAIVIPDGTTALILDPIGTLATGSITMPATPIDGQVVHILSSQTITALTVSPTAGQSIKGAPSGLAANASVAWIYVMGNATWYRVI